MRSNGYQHGPPEARARLPAGAPAGADEYYFRTAMTFRTGSPAWAKVISSNMLAIGKVARQPDAAVLDVCLVE